MQTRPAIARAVDQAKGVRELRIDDGGAQLVVVADRRVRRFIRLDRADSAVRAPITRRAERHRFVCGRMLQRQLHRVEEDPLRRRAAVERVAENGKTMRGGVNANLVCAPGHGPRFDEREAIGCLQRDEPGLGTFAPGNQRTVHVFFPGPNDGGDGGQVRPRDGPVGDQQIFLLHLARGELFRERTVGLGSFSEHEHAARFLVEPVEDGEPRPARFAVLEPVIHALAGEGARRVRVPARRLVDGQQVLVLEQDQRHRGDVAGKIGNQEPGKMSERPPMGSSSLTLRKRAHSISRS